MSLLVSEFRGKVSKLKDYRMRVETEYPVSYSTGFLGFDFRNGCIMQNFIPNKEPVEYFSIGIQDGSMVMIIGRSGCGKTSWAIQSAANIVRKFENGTIFHDDIEAATTLDRKLTLTKFTEEELESKYIHRNTGITAENFYERVKMIHDIKLSEREKFEYNTGIFDYYGNPIIKLEPTVYILDSLALLMPNTFAEEEELSGNMSATAMARVNASVFKRIVPMLKAANIILLIINHINQKVEINAFARTKSQVSYLKQGETLPGGNSPIYLSNVMIRLDDNTKLTDDKEFGINGSLVDFGLVKSRSNKAGNDVVTLLFNQEEGYDPILSLFILLKQKNMINGQGLGMYLGDRNDLKFSQKTFKNKLADNIELQTLFSSLCFEVLKEYLVRTEKVNTTELSNIIGDSIMSKIGLN